MIRGIGVDLVDIDRVARLYERYGVRFSRRILAAGEWVEFNTAARPELYLATRFAAKEAFSKATGTGITNPVTFHSLSIFHRETGQPAFRFFRQLPEFLSRLGVEHHHLTLTHEKGMVCAVVILEG